MPVVMQYGQTQLTLRDPEFANREETVLGQVRGRTASGVLYVYDKGVRSSRMTLEFRYLEESEKTALEAFHRDTVLGSLHTFSLTDHKGRQWTARFLGGLEFTEVRDGRWNCLLELEVEAAS